MRFRRALLAIACCAGSAGVAGAQDGRQVEIGYEITFAGITGFRVDMTGRFVGSAYDVESHAYKEGVLRALTIRYEGRNRAWGTVTATGALPSAGSLSLVVGDKTRTWLAQYGPGGLTSQTFTPEWKPQPKEVIPEDQVRASLDPLSAALSAGMSGDAACDKTVPSNDGKRRIDVLLKKIGTETPAKADVPTAKGDLLVCEIYTKRVAGEFDDAPEEAESKREAPMKLWLGRFDNTPFRYPARLEAKTGFGTIHGRMLFFRDRPLTDEEKTKTGR